MKLTHLRFPLTRYAATQEDDSPWEREEPTVKLDLAIERLKEATERQEHARRRVNSSPAIPAVKVPA